MTAIRLTSIGGVEWEVTCRIMRECATGFVCQASVAGANGLPRERYPRSASIIIPANSAGSRPRLIQA